MSKDLLQEAVAKALEVMELLLILHLNIVIKIKIIHRLLDNKTIKKIYADIGEMILMMPMRKHYKYQERLIKHYKLKRIPNL